MERRMIGRLLCHSAAVCQNVVDKIRKGCCVDRAEYETMQHVMFSCSKYTSETKLVRNLPSPSLKAQCITFNCHIFA